jgi:hypothetical protein
MISLRVLNDCTIITPSARITPNAKLLFSLAFYLVLERGKLIPRDVLISLFWPNVSPRSARHSLRRALWQLRRYGFPLGHEHESHVFLPKDAASLDIDTFIQESDETTLTQPFTLLPWIPKHGAPEFKDWVDDIRYIIHTRITLRLNAAAAQAKARADWPLVLSLSERTLEIDPDCSTARTNAAQARQALRTQNGLLPQYPKGHLGISHLVKRPQLLIPTNTPLRAVTLLGESTPPPYQRSNTEPPHTALQSGGDSSYRSDLHLLLSLLDNTFNNAGSLIHLLDTDRTQTAQLLNDFTTIAKERGAHTISTTFLDHHSRSPLSALSTLIPALQNAPGAAGCDPNFTKHLAHIGSSDSESSFTPSTETLLALSDLLSAIADEQPLILIIQDYSYADPTSLSLLGGLGPTITQSAILLIFTTHTPLTQSNLEKTQETRLLQLCTTLEREITNAITFTPIHHEKIASMLATLRNVKTTLRTSSNTVDSPNTPHDDLELLTLNTLRHTERHWLPIANSAYECISATHATPEHRLEAGTLLCTLATAMGDAPLIREAQQILHPLYTDTHEGHTLPHLKFQALSHALIGDSTLATQTTHELLTLARQTQRSPELLTTLFLAGNAFHSCGDIESAAKTYLEAFSRSTRDRWLPQAMQSAYALTKLSLDRGNLDDAHVWCHRMTCFMPSTDAIWDQQTALLLQLRVALAHNNIAHASQLFESVMPLLTAPLLCVRATACASQIRLLILQGNPKGTIQQKAEELLTLSQPLRDFRLFHYEFFTLYLAFTFSGEKERGTQILQEYLERSKGTTLPPESLSQDRDAICKQR